MKKKLIIILIVVLLVVAVAGGFFWGVNKVRNGLIANYPTVKNLVQGATTEVDSSVTFVIYKTADSKVFELIAPATAMDSLVISVPYYARFVIDLSVRNFRVFDDKGTVEVWLPVEKVVNCNLKLDRLTINGAYPGYLFKSEKYHLATSKIYELLIPEIEKNKAHSLAARKTVARALMFYFMPYKYNLKLYVDNQQFPLPKVPGVNQTPEEAIKEMLGQ